MRIGADYYPEHWEKERWKTDAEMMVKANIKVIRIGEFAWSLYEPEEGKYEFDWMDEALDFFGKYGIKVVMCTPSATPPKWMIDKYSRYSSEIFMEIRSSSEQESITALTVRHTEKKQKN